MLAQIITVTQLDEQAPFSGLITRAVQWLRQASRLDTHGDEDQRTRRAQRIGIIDLGSNTTRLIVMAYERDRYFKLVDEVSEVVRLAEGIGADGRMQSGPMYRAIEALKMFHTFCRATGVDDIVAVGTSAVREAANGEAFLEILRQQTGLELNIIDAEEEAFFGYLGATNALYLQHGFVFDTGGGSTQVIEVRDRRYVRSFSRQAGVVRFTERYVKSDPISKRDLRALRNGARNVFSDLEWMQAAPGLTLVGLGGTVRQLARIDQKLRFYPLDKVHAYILTRDAVETIIEQLAVRNRREREQVPGLKGERADVTLAGAVIISQLMEQSRFTSLQVSGHGLREGLFYANFLNSMNPPLLPNPREFSVYSLARISHYEAAHAERVAQLSLSLFDQVAALHGYGTWERELLHYAAILHDIGVQVGYYDHHKHSAYLVLNGSLLGFSHREIALIAYLVRNHRKGLADLDEYKAVLVSSDGLRIEQLSALLRIAEYLERSKSGVVRRLRVHIAPELITIAVEAVGDATVEIWDTNRRTGLFERAFGRAIRIVEGES